MKSDNYLLLKVEQVLLKRETSFSKATFGENPHIDRNRERWRRIVERLD
jgi:hypothetical protein